jgi:hypothetical protein
MANTSGEATIQPASSPIYRPLHRNKNEFRLPKILPPASPLEAGAGPLEFSQEPIRCELRYESLDVLANRLSAKQSSVNSILAYLLQDIPRMRANETETDAGALMDLLGNKLGSKLSIDKDTVHEIGSEKGSPAGTTCFGRFEVELEGGQSIFSFPLDISEEDDETLNQVLASQEFKAPMVTTFNMIRDLFADFGLWDTSFRDLFPARAADVDPASFSAPEIEGSAMSLARLFTTFGGYVGTCLGNVRAGNELFLLAGCSMPVLLKKSAAVSGA